MTYEEIFNRNSKNGIMEMNEFLKAQNYIQQISELEYLQSLIPETDDKLKMNNIVARINELTKLLKI
ncbi:hypothetical protein GW931_02805 [archaeon]|nr:hypothetical protein [archaeon]